MKRFVRLASPRAGAATWLLALIVPLLLTGCFTFENVIHLKRDGSGTLDQVVVLYGPMLDMLRSFAGDEELNLCAEEDLMDQATQMGTGVRLMDAEPIEESGRLGCRATFAFDDINTLTIVQDIQEKLPEDVGPDDEMESEEPQDITFRYDPGAPATLVVNMSQDYEKNAAEADEEGEGLSDDSAQREMQLQMMREMLQDSYIHVALEVDGAITDTDAAYYDDDTVTFIEIDFNELLKDEESFETVANARPRSPQEAKAVLAGIEGVRIETSQQVRVQFD